MSVTDPKASDSELLPGEAQEQSVLLGVSLLFLGTLIGATWVLGLEFEFRSDKWYCRESDIASYTFPLIAATIAAAGAVVRVRGRKIDAPAYALSVLFLIVSLVAFIRFKATGPHIGLIILVVLFIQLASLSGGALKIAAAKKVGWLTAGLGLLLFAGLLRLAYLDDLPNLQSCEAVLNPPPASQTSP